VGVEGSFGAMAAVSGVVIGSTAGMLAGTGARSVNGDVGIYNRFCAIGICVHRRSWSEMRYGC
jgi:hypothetical protein